MALMTKEGTALPWPDVEPQDLWPQDEALGARRSAFGEPDDPNAEEQTPNADPEARVQAARSALAGEWRAANPQTPEDVAGFYRTAQGLEADLAAWHARPDRAEATRMLVHVAQQAGVTTVVDIGCGAGHDLLALRAALPGVALHGIEPNDRLRRRIPRDARITLFFSAAGMGPPDLAQCVAADGVLTHCGPAPIETADLLICIDVLEHVPDPEIYLAGIAQRAPVGCLLFEAVATSDLGTPLHLPANAGWKPGRVLERHGWEMVDTAGRVRVWRRERSAGAARAGLLLCAYRSVSVDSLASIMACCAGSSAGASWRLKVKAGDALISRSRAVLLTEWWRSTNDTVALMVDDDVTFAPGDADHIAELCRGGFDVICGAYPVRNGAHLALRTLDGTQDVRFGPGEPPLEVRFAATGFVAIHRRVIDALVAGAAGDMPLCHPRESWSHYNLFPTMVIEDGDHGPVILSEDWGFSELCRRAGFRIYLDPTVRLQHASTLPVSVANMAAVHAAIERV